jgi:hypothetical protein
MSETKINSTANATLAVKGLKERNIIEYNYSFSQAIDLENQPTGIPRGGKLTVKVEAVTRSEKTNELFGWMVSKTKKDGKIVVKKPSKRGEDLKILKFEDAFCVEYKEIWKDIKSGADTSNTEEIVISWRKLTWDDVEFDYGWL